MTIKKFNMRALWAIIILLGFNSYINFVEIQAVQSKLAAPAKPNQFICIKTGEIRSKHNVILSCNEVK
jgi:hypothetical protein